MKRIAMLCMLVACVATVGVIPASTQSYHSDFVLVSTEPVVLLPEEYILNKTTQVEISRRWTPVMLFAVTHDRTMGKYIGCGSLYNGSVGEEIVTSEHLFPVAEGMYEVMFRKLRPFESDIGHEVERVLWKGTDVTRDPNVSPDIVVLKVGESLPIKCFSRQSIDPYAETSQFKILDNPETLTSLVSGEKVRLVGFADSVSDPGVTYIVIEYNPIAGESGTGFVNDQGHLYVLKGSISLGKENAVDAKKRFGITGHLSFVYGPISLDK